mmetsp:Transcript_147608/g.269228  ORF Transcript_147608/g.269228 Transcript_147608/m.269228 type:complete len:208 (+) Transcript_147608:445-1068(+)
MRGSGTAEDYDDAKDATDRYDEAYDGAGMTVAVGAVVAMAVVAAVAIVVTTAVDSGLSVRDLGSTCLNASTCLQIARSINWAAHGRVFGGASMIAALTLLMVLKATSTVLRSFSNTTACQATHRSKLNDVLNARVDSPQPAGSRACKAITLNEISVILIVKARPFDRSDHQQRHQTQYGDRHAEKGSIHPGVEASAALSKRHSGPQI